MMTTKSTKNLESFVIHFFLSPKSWGFRGLTFFWFLTLGFFCWRSWGLNSQFGWLFVCFSMLILKGFSWVRWYPGFYPKRAGIEDHFDKVSVLTVWLSIFGVLLSLICHSFLLLYLTGVMLLPFILVNGVLVYCHLQDSDPMAPNALSGDSRVF